MSAILPGLEDDNALADEPSDTDSTEDLTPRYPDLGSSNLSDGRDPSCSPRDFEDLSVSSSPRRFRVGPLAQLELENNPSATRSGKLLSPGERSFAVVDSPLDVLRRLGNRNTAGASSPSRGRSRAEAGSLHRPPAQPEQIAYTADWLSTMSAFAALTDTDSKKKPPRIQNMMKRNRTHWRLSFWTEYSHEKSAREMRKVLQSYLKLEIRDRNHGEFEVDPPDKTLKNCPVRFRLEGTPNDNVTEIILEIKTDPTDTAARAFGKFFEECKREIGKTGIRGNHGT